jgi:hypothetical protein
MMTENVMFALKSLAEINPELKALLPEVAASDGDAGAGNAYVQLRARAFIALED